MHVAAAASNSRVCVLTPPGRGAVAVVAAAGAGAQAAVDAHFRAANGRQAHEQKRDRIVFGHWTTGEHCEEVILLRGEGDALEVHCHGGAAAVGRIVDACIAAGCQPVDWKQWISSDSDAITAEADSALARATTRRTAAILLDQRNGALARELATIHSLLTAGTHSAARQSIEQLIGRGGVGLHLTQPWQVAIAGRPNVGKSSLMNAIVGYQRAIVFDQPGTTRDVLAADTAIDGWPVRLTDAAGIRETDDELESAGVRRAQQTLARADLVLWVLDATTLSDLREARTDAANELAGTNQLTIPDNWLIVINKMDRIERPTAVRDASVVCTSAVTQAGLDELLQKIAWRLAPSPPTSGAAVPFNERQIDLLKNALAALAAGDESGAVTALRQIAGRP